jgi:transposase, IS5 family
LRDANQKLIEIAKASRAQAKRVRAALRESAQPRAEALGERLEHFVPLVEQGIAQASRRLLYGEHLPAAQKLLSLFEEHTQIITRHKAGKPREFAVARFS